ncbi:TIGR03943 family protein [Candidatus Gracilibacteria bacterium]|nr:TIGR03943 family protein [Candidatus Gracilibacteria bacterium]
MEALSPRPLARSINWYVLSEVLLLGGTATLLLAKWLRGHLAFYIHPRYIPLMVVAAVILLLMAAVRLRAAYEVDGPQRPGWGSLLLAIPLLFGVLVPAQPLGASSLPNRGIESSPANSAVGRNLQLDGDTSTWNLLEWSTALSMRGDELDGKPADVVAFVFQDAKLGGDSFYAVRYVVTCCAADGAGVGLPVRWAGGDALPEDSWVRVRGTIATETINGTPQPVIIAAAVEPVDQPANPYLYP